MALSDPALLDQHFAQYEAYVAAQQSLQFPTLRDSPIPSAPEYKDYAARIEKLETNLLCKRDQIDALWLTFRAWMNAGAQNEALACLERAVPVVAMSPSKFPFAKLPGIGNKDDFRRQGRVMAEMAEDGFWNVDLSERVEKAAKALSKAASK